jgi:hypothetical protein
MTSNMAHHHCPGLMKMHPKWKSINLCYKVTLSQQHHKPHQTLVELNSSLIIQPHLTNVPDHPTLTTGYLTAEPHIITLPSSAIFAMFKNVTSQSH